MAGEAGLFTGCPTMDTVLCLECANEMQPNAVYTCVKCLSIENNITDGLRKQIDLKHCPGCDSYLQPPQNWVKLQSESKELLAICLKKLKKNFDLYQVRMVHAEFIGTEPRSERIRIKVKVQKEIVKGVTLEQSYPVEFVRRKQMCGPCSKVHGNLDQWVATVQIRQCVHHMRTFFNLEQVILKHNAAAGAIRIKREGLGIDFFFSTLNHAVKFVEFLWKVAPLRGRQDKDLESRNPKSYGNNYKYTFLLEISPICCEDLIFLPPKAAGSLGNLGPLVICVKVTNRITLLDPFTLRHCSLDGNQYWRSPFKSLLSSRQLVEYVVLDLEYLIDAKGMFSEVTVEGKRYSLAYAQVARVSDHKQFYIKTHMGTLLEPGDRALGYDVHRANINDSVYDMRIIHALPEVILIKKSYDGEEKLEEERKTEAKYADFVKDLEENPDRRFKPVEKMMEGLRIDGDEEDMME